MTEAVTSTQRFGARINEVNTEVSANKALFLEQDDFQSTRVCVLDDLDLESVLDFLEEAYLDKQFRENTWICEFTDVDGTAQIALIDPDQKVMLQNTLRSNGVKDFAVYTAPAFYQKHRGTSLVPEHLRPQIEEEPTLGTQFDVAPPNIMADIKGIGTWVFDRARALLRRTG